MSRVHSGASGSVAIGYQASYLSAGVGCVFIGKQAGMEYGTPVNDMFEISNPNILYLRGLLNGCDRF